MGRAISARWTAITRRRCATPRCGWPRRRRCCWTDIDKDTVDFQPNYDESEKEPKVLPAQFPNLLVNGGNGIAVGMATNIPPHNPGEIIDATLALIADPDTSLDELMRIVPGPDFPTGGIIIGRSGIRAGVRDRARSRSPCARAPNSRRCRKDRQAIIVTEIPYQVNKKTLLERIAELVREKQIEGITDMRDESDRSGMRVVIELRRDATPEVVLNQLYRFTQLQTTFGINMLALDNGQPRQMGLKDALHVLHPLPRGGDPPPRPVRTGARRASARITWWAWRSRSPISTR